MIPLKAQWRFLYIYLTITVIAPAHLTFQAFLQALQFPLTVQKHVLKIY